jgi:hypothetical protein
VNTRPSKPLIGVTLAVGCSTALIGMVAERPWITVLGLIAGVVVLFLDDL